MKPTAIFENANIYEFKFIKDGHGITLPNLGIFVSPKIYSQQKDLWLIKHEFGHILQYREFGFLKFYFKIGLPSLFSAIKQCIQKNYYHQNHPVEIDANKRAYQYFGQPEDWPFKKFPLMK